MNNIISWLQDEVSDISRAISKLYAKKGSVDLDDEIPFLEGQHFAYNTVLQKLKVVGTGRLRSDDSGHWYLVPENKADLFYPMLDKTNRGLSTDEEHQDEFIDIFDQYRLPGGVEDLVLPMVI